MSQIWGSDPCSDSGYNHRSNRNLPIFLLEKWPHRLLPLPKLKSDSGSGSVFLPNFWLRVWVRKKNAESHRIGLRHSGSSPTSVKDLIKPSQRCLPGYFVKTSKSEKQAHSRNGRTMKFFSSSPAWSDKIESDPGLIRKIFENHQFDPVLIR